MILHGQTAVQLTLLHVLCLSWLSLPQGIQPPKISGLVAKGRELVERTPIPPPTAPLPLARELPDWSLAGPSILGSSGSEKHIWQEATVIITTPSGFGSGAIVSPDGLVMTNYHVVAGELQSRALAGGHPEIHAIMCRVEGGMVSRHGDPARIDVVDVDPVRDLALLQIDSARVPDAEPFKFASNVESGSACFVIGSQGGGLAWAIRGGTVAGKYMFPSGITENVIGYSSSSSSFDRTRATIIVTDCPISEGDSGGPLLNSSGELIGLTFAGPTNRSAGAMGYHIAAEEMKAFLERERTNADAIPFDVWNFGNSDLLTLQPVLLDVDKDGSEESLFLPVFDADTQEVVGGALFVNCGSRAAAKKNAKLTQQSEESLAPYGIWGGFPGQFRFDVVFGGYQLKDGSSRQVVGMSSTDSILESILIDADGDDVHEVMWTQKGGRWVRSSGLTKGLADLLPGRLSSSESETLSRVCAAWPSSE